MAETIVTAQTSKPENVVERNVALLGHLMRYLLEEPHIFNALPDNFELVILPDDDAEMRRHNLELLDAFVNEGKPVVFVRLKSSKVTDFHRAQPKLYVPLAM